MAMTMEERVATAEAQVAELRVLADEVLQMVRTRLDADGRCDDDTCICHALGPDAA